MLNRSRFILGLPWLTEISVTCSSGFSGRNLVRFELPGISCWIQLVLTFSYFNL